MATYPATAMQFSHRALSTQVGIGTPAELDDAPPSLEADGKAAVAGPETLPKECEQEQEEEPVAFFGKMDGFRDVRSDSIREKQLSNVVAAPVIAVIPPLSPAPLASLGLYAAFLALGVSWS